MLLRDFLAKEYLTLLNGAFPHLFRFLCKKIHSGMKTKETTCTHDTADFEKVVQRIRHRLLQTAIGYLHDADEAEDAVQETLIRCWTVRQRLGKMDELPPFAMRVLKNLCTDLLHQRTWPAGTMEEDESPSPEARLINREQQDWMMECLKRLPVGARAVLQMKGIDGLSYQEMAAILGTTEATVRAKVAKARQKLWEIYHKRK